MFAQEEKTVIAAVGKLSGTLPRKWRVAVLDELLNGLRAIDLGGLSDSGRDKLRHHLCLEEARLNFPRQKREAEEILETLKVSKEGLLSLTIPAGLGDIDAMKALNAYSPACYGPINLDVVRLLAEEAGVKARDVSKKRIISINPLVEGTIGKNRIEQEAVLRKAGMTFAAPEEVVLVAAAYECKNKGEKLLRQCTRTAALNYEVDNDNIYGLHIHYWEDENIDREELGASGVALPGVDFQI